MFSIIPVSCYGIIYTFPWNWYISGKLRKKDIMIWYDKKNIIDYTQTDRQI